jgi:uncharacterized protein (DUF697 family)
MAMPIDIKDLVRSGTRLRKDREQPVHLVVAIEADAPDALIDALRTRLRPGTAGARVTVEVVDTDSGQPLNSADALVAVVGSAGVRLRRALDAARAARIPCVAVALGGGNAVGTLADALGQPLADLLIGTDAEEVVGEGLARWLAEEISSKRLALAHNFTFMRRAVADEAVRTTAWQNALIGAVAIIPGADMPIMTANQGKMLLQIAAAYGEPLGAERMKELAAVVGAGFALRTVARQAVGLVPVLGWAVKGGFGYAGTLAMGKAAIGYFDQGADLTQVVDAIKGAASEAAARLPHRSPHAPPLTQMILPELDEPGAASGTPGVAR